MNRQQQGDWRNNQVLVYLSSLFGGFGIQGAVRAMGVTPEQYQRCLRLSSGVILRDEERFTNRQDTPAYTATVGLRVRLGRQP